MKNNVRLTAEQQRLVEENISIVHWVIVNSIHVNPSVFGLGYDDLFQEGCFFLCQASQSYRPDGCKFPTYAKKVIRNGLISYCRAVCRKERHFCQLELDCYGEPIQIDVIGMQVFPSDSLTEKELLALLDERREQYSGVARKGVEALTLRIQGVALKDIAEIYHAPSTHVGAWIVRSLEKLRRDEAFMDAIA